MGHHNFRAKAEGLEDDIEVRGDGDWGLLEDSQLMYPAFSQVHPGQSRRHRNGSMSGFWQNQGRCYVGRNSGHRRKVEMDDPARRKGIET